MLGLLLVAATLAPLSHAEATRPIILLNEVLYDPPPGEDEWIELHNAGHDVELEGITITDQDGHAYTFPSLLFPSGAYLLLVVGEGTDTGFENGSAILHMGLSRQILNDDGDDLLLEGYGEVLDFFRYGDGPAVDPPPPQYPWEGSAETAPEGLSLALQPDGLLEDTAENWKASKPTPGGPNAVPEEGRLVLAEVYYHANRDNEYILLENAGSQVVDLAGWSLTDGEGIWLLPPAILEPGEKFLAAQNATSLLEDGGLRADACVTGCEELITPVGRMSLNNEGDEVRLLDAAGRLVDAFLYGSATTAEGWEGDPASALSRGYVARRRWDPSGPVDTNTSLDWEWGRTFRLGQGQRPVSIFNNVLARPLISPEDSLQDLLSILDSSKRSIILSGFTLTNVHIADALVAALKRGVAVQVGLEGSPPGGVEDAQREILSRLEAASARILVMGTREDSWRRYAYHHAKFLIVDGTWVLLGSENFSANGFPGSGVGNRGWGVVVFSAEMAAWLRQVVEEDWNLGRSDVQLLSDGPSPSEAASTETPQHLIPARAVGLLSPDNAVSSEGILGVLGDAERSIDVQLFYLREDWRGGENPLLEALFEAARRGVRVRILLDGSALNVQRQGGNDWVAAGINEVARGEGLSLKARLFRPSEDRVKLHNKGLIVDGEGVLVSSINWNYHGAYENREAGLYLVSEGLASAYAAAFELDWGQTNEPPRAVITGPAMLKPGTKGIYSALESIDDISVVRYAWDLHGDGSIDGSGPSFSFTPTEAGSYVLRLRVMDAEGGEDTAEIVIRVAEGLGASLDIPRAVMGVATGLAAFLWLRKLRTRRQPTNKSQGIEKREGHTSDLGSGD